MLRKRHRSRPDGTLSIVFTLSRGDGPMSASMNSNRLCRWLVGSQMPRTGNDENRGHSLRMQICDSGEPEEGSNSTSIPSNPWLMTRRGRTNGLMIDGAPKPASEIEFGSSCCQLLKLGQPPACLGTDFAATLHDLHKIFPSYSQLQALDRVRVGIELAHGGPYPGLA